MKEKIKSKQSLIKSTSGTDLPNNDIAVLTKLVVQYLNKFEEQNKKINELET